jgi:hypothetical protein
MAMASDPPGPPLGTGDTGDREQLNTAWTQRASQDQVLWLIFGAFWPTNAILLVALLQSADRIPLRVAGLVICGAGILAATCWLLIQSRAIGHIRRLEAVARRLEHRLAIDDDIALSESGPGDDTFLSGPRARLIMQGCTIMIGLGWLIGFCFFFWGVR